MLRIGGGEVGGAVLMLQLTPGMAARFLFHCSRSSSAPSAGLSEGSHRRLPKNPRYHIHQGQQMSSTEEAFEYLAILDKNTYRCLLTKASLLILFKTPSQSREVWEGPCTWLKLEAGHATCVPLQLQETSLNVSLDI